MAWYGMAWQETEDVEYAMEGEMEDVFDSDFDDDEPDNEEGEASAEVKERPAKRRLLPPGAKKKAKKPAKAAKKGAGGKKAGVEKETAGVEEERGGSERGESAKSKAGKKSGPSKNKQSRELAMLRLGRLKKEGEGGEKGEDGQGEELTGIEEIAGDAAVDLTEENWEAGGGRGGGGVERRKSTRTAVVVRDMERQAMRAAREGAPKVVRRKKEGERRWTQEEMLLEAAQTEILNREALEVMLAREEEVKRKAVVEKAIFGGPQIRFHSKDGKNTLEFTKVTAMPPEINAKAPPYPAKPTCAITGLPAKYRDPLTGQPYATVEAFKVLRQIWQEDQATKRKLKKAAKAEARLKSKAGGMDGKGHQDTDDRPMPGTQQFSTSKGRIVLGNARALPASSTHVARIPGSKQRTSL
ncbi:hypothetical protein CLOM_g7899 [Closterium sp. NIES-68]|nr:hypothetical protein CLOM_g7899 [Closterium sp. NIES-68]GJP58234.1 hypothetical protein CLOP_g22701 [Closterium sp. NIES-67]